MTPEQLRLAYHADTQTSPAVAALKAALMSGKASEDAFYRWLAEPFTQAVTRALEELADNPPVSGADVALQYGVTSGLQLAVKLMTQPKRVFPEVFQDAPQIDEGLDKSYTANADSVIDSM
jgi:hypothetical protein